MLDTEGYEGELFELRKIKKLLQHTLIAERFGNQYFICGEGGGKDKNNLPDMIWVCPAYGCDWAQVYEKTNITHGPGY